MKRFNGSDRMQRIDPRVADLVQAGEIRTALFLPQYIKNSTTGELRGIGMGFVAIEITRALAAALGVDVTVIEHPTPTAAIESLKTMVCDVSFLGIEQSRTTEIDFSPPVVQFDYTYLVPADSLIHNAADADQPGVRIAVVRNHASSFALGRIVKHAELIDAEIPDDAFDLLRTGDADAFAAPREQLLDYSLRLSGSRVLADSYGFNLVAMAVPKGQNKRLDYFSEFIEKAKTSGLIQRVIDCGTLRGFQVAP
jgi:polar amino acid transport system substrate-binding protein